MTSLLAEQDKKGPPYTLPWPSPQGMTYALAAEIAASAHPSRVLATTSVYRYGRFTEIPLVGIGVRLFGHRIALFTPDGLQLWTCGYSTASTIEAFNSLVTGGWFYRDKRVIYFERYGARQAPDYAPCREAFTEGQLFPYPAEGKDKK